MPATKDIKRNRWKRTATGRLTRQSTASSTNITTDEPTIASVSKVNQVSFINGFGHQDSDHEHTFDISPITNGVYFEDGLRRIDFILVFEESLQNQGEEGLERHIRRQFFENNLVRAGLELEEDAHKKQETSSSPAKMTVFTKVHAPWSVLCRQAEALKMRMPLQLTVIF